MRRIPDPDWLSSIIGWLVLGVCWFTALVLLVGLTVVLM